MIKRERAQESRFLQRWPQLTLLAERSATVYVLPTSQELTQACAAGELELSGHDLALTRLDMALIGVMEECGEDYFLYDFFANRLAAAVEILLAALASMEQEAEDLSPSQQRLRLFAAEAESALSQWDKLLAEDSEQTLLYAAEEAAELI